MDSSSPALSPPGSSRRCICTLEDITAQALDQDEEVRFRCLAFEGQGDDSYQCMSSCKKFDIENKLLYRKAWKVLWGTRREIPVPEFRLVMRGLFCCNHRASRLFGEFFKLIEPNWIGDGNVKERELLKAIRDRHAPIAQRTSWAAIDTSMTSPSSVMSTPRMVRSSNDPQSLPRPSKELADDTLLRHTRSKSNPRNEVHRRQDLNNHLSVESDEDNTLAYEISYISSRSNSRSEGPVTSSNARTPTPRPSIELPLLNSRLPQGSTGRQRNTPEPNSPFCRHQEVASRQRPKSALNSTRLPESSSIPNPPSQPWFDISFPMPQIQPTNSRPQTASANTLRSSHATSIFSNQDESRPFAASNRQPKQLSEPKIPISSVLTNSATPPNQPLFTWTSNGSSQDVSRQAAKLSGQLKPAPDRRIPSSSPLTTPSKEPWQLPFDSASYSINSDLVNPVAKKGSHMTPKNKPLCSRPGENTSLEDATHTIDATPSPPHSGIGRSHSASIFPLQSLFSSSDQNFNSSPVRPLPTTRANQARLGNALPRSRRRDNISPRQTSHPADAAPPSLSHPGTEQSNQATGGTIAEAILYPRQIDQVIRDIITGQKTPGGYTYVLRAPQYFQNRDPPLPPLVKIGKSKDVQARMSKLRHQCKIPDLSRVTDREEVIIDEFEKVEIIVHAALQNFQRDPECKVCKSKGKGLDTCHKEWFNVSEDVALQTVQLWRKFAEQKPWDQDGIIKDYWVVMLRDMEAADEKEEWDDPQRQNERWAKWLDDAIKGKKRLNHCENE